MQLVNYPILTSINKFVFILPDTARMTDGGGGGTGGMSFPMKVHTDDEDFVIELEGKFVIGLEGKTYKF